MGGLARLSKGRSQLRPAFSCETEVEQHPQREEEPHNRNSEPPAILLCHESPDRACLSTRMIAFRFRENCAVQHVPNANGAGRESARPDSFSEIGPHSGPSIRTRASGFLESWRGLWSPRFF